MYKLTFDEKKKKQTNWINFAFSVAFILVIICAGMINPDSSRTVWIVYPYLFTYLPVAFFLIGCINYGFAKTMMTDEVYQTGLMRIKHSVYAIFIMSGLDILLDLIYIIVNHANINVLHEVEYILFYPVMILIGLIFSKYYDRTYSNSVCPLLEDEHK